MEDVLVRLLQRVVGCSHLALVAALAQAEHPGLALHSARAASGWRVLGLSGSVCSMALALKACRWHCPGTGPVPEEANKEKQLSVSRNQHDAARCLRDIYVALWGLEEMKPHTKCTGRLWSTKSQPSAWWQFAGVNFSRLLVGYSLGTGQGFWAKEMIIITISIGNVAQQQGTCLESAIERLRVWSKICQWWAWNVPNPCKAWFSSPAWSKNKKEKG